MARGLWITWENQRRNKGISEALSFPLYEIINEKSMVSRYIFSIFKTISILVSNKPRLVAAQNPSIVLTVLILLLKKIFRYKVIIDSHNSGIFPLEGRSKLLMTASGIIQRFSDITLVTNEKLKSVVKSNKGNAVVLPDKIPNPPQAIDPIPLAGTINIACICTFSEDEPYQEVIQAARHIPENVYIYFTGKYEGKIDINSISENIKLLGFIPDQEYWELLYSVDIVMDLTFREDCLVCGAYEGVAVSKPLILSDTAALKSYFNQGCIYVLPSTESIAQGIKTAIENYDALKIDILRLKSNLAKSWQKQLSALKISLS